MGGTLKRREGREGRVAACVKPGVGVIATFLDDFLMENMVYYPKFQKQ